MQGVALYIQEDEEKIRLQVLRRTMRNYERCFVANRSPARIEASLDWRKVWSIDAVKQCPHTCRMWACKSPAKTIAEVAAKEPAR